MSRYGKFGRRVVQEDRYGLFIHFCQLARLRPSKHTKYKKGDVVSATAGGSSLQGGPAKVFTNAVDWELWL
jgi:hypothetical protein